MWSAIPVALLCMVVNQNDGNQGSGPKETDSARADSRPERTGFWPDRADFRPERADFRPERADLRPERTWGDRWTDGQTDRQIPPVFYMTSSPLGPLPCSPSTQITHYSSRA